MTDKTKDFIDKAKIVHGDKYDYSKVEYIKNTDKIIITCKTHGDFEQTPKGHVKGSGCKLCANIVRANKRKKDITEFIAKALEIHGDKYNYLFVEYINSQTKVIITCKIHGNFEQTPNAHLIGQWCKICANEKSSIERKSNNNEFVIKATQVHGDKYDYSSSKYNTASEKINIICKKHGIFEQTPNSHLCGRGCDKCKNEETSNRFKSNKEEFQNKANEIHNNFYDYSKVEYINSQTKVIITCNIHGDFEQVPNSHLQGTGCHKCSGNQIRNQKDFLEKAREVHNDKFDYSKVEYVNSQTKVIITCNTHGDFEQMPNSHISGNGGCYKCAGKFSTNQTEFIEKSNEIHNNFYDYSKVEYINSQTKVIITCKIHGDFEQVPNSHLQGCGCNKCAIIKRREARQFTLNEFIEKSNKIHNNFYDYSKVEYINSQTKVIITCKIHGDFEQVPSSHLQGCGCNNCSIIKRSDSQRFIISDFIKQSNNIHSSKYDYSKAEYTGANNDIIIICKFHGEFKQKPSKHINAKQGCIKCSGTYQFTTSEFITKSMRTHGNKYNYEKSNYMNTKTKVIITCYKCGDFEQNPSEHYNGANCPNCINSNYSKQSIAYLNFISKYNNIYIQHAENGSEYRILNVGKADGYCKENNTIYEYHGDFWHGNPKKHKHNCINKRNGKTFGELYQKTIEREQQIRDFGFNLITIWESDWIKLNKCVKILQRKFRISKLH